MNADPALALLTLAMCAIVVVQHRTLERQRRDLERQRQRAEEAESWSDEYQREAEALQRQYDNLLQDLRWKNRLN